MGKLNKIIFIMAVITLFFHLAGIVPDSPSRVLIDMLIDYENFATTPFYAKIVAIVALLTIGGLVVGSIVGGKFEIALKAPMFLVVIEIIWAWIGIIKELAKFNESVALVIGAPLLLLFVMIAFDWLFGRD